VHLPNWLGDSVVATATLSSLRLALPERPIDIVANPVAAAVVAEHPAVRDGHFHRRGASLAERIRLGRRLARRRYGASLTLAPSFSAVLVARAVGAIVRIGFDGPGRRLGFNRRVRRPARGALHLADEFRALVAALGIDARAMAPAVRVNAEAAARMRDLIGRRDYLVLAPGATYGPAKRWLVERFAEAGERLARRRGWGVVIVGGAGDDRECTAVANALDASVINLCAQTSIPELAAVLAGARLLLANDSGPMHLAAAVGTRVVGVFGSSEPAWTAPIGGEFVTCDPRPVCAPCYRRTCDVGYVCMTELGVERVVVAGERALADRAVIESGRTGAEGAG
jgi:heptosyltransferase-2